MPASTALMHSTNFTRPFLGGPKCGKISYTMTKLKCMSFRKAKTPIKLPILSNFRLMSQYKTLFSEIGQKHFKMHCVHTKWGRGSVNDNIVQIGLHLALYLPNQCINSNDFLLHTIFCAFIWYSVGKNVSFLAPSGDIQKPLLKGKYVSGQVV